MNEAPRMIPLGLGDYDIEVVWRIGLRLEDETPKDGKPITRLCVWQNREDAKAIRDKLIRHGGEKIVKTHDDIEEITVTGALLVAKERNAEWVAICTFIPPEKFEIVRLVAV